MSKTLKGKFPYRVEYNSKNKRLWNFLTIALFPIDDEYADRLLTTVYPHVANALGFISVCIPHQCSDTWEISEIQSDVLGRRGLPASFYNKYKYWHRWAFYELLLEANKQNINTIWCPSALEMWYMRKAIPEIDADIGRERRSLKLFKHAPLNIHLQAWRRYYDFTMIEFGGNYEHVWDTKRDNYVRINGERLVVECLYVIDVNGALKIASKDLEEENARV